MGAPRETHDRAIDHCYARTRAPWRGSAGKRWARNVVGRWTSGSNGEKHQQVAAADREYKREVTAAKRVFEHKKAEAKKKRGAAVSVAHQGVSQ
jgi:hypothetical protein